MANTHHYRYEAQPEKKSRIDREAWLAQALAATARLRESAKASAQKKSSARGR